MASRRDFLSQMIGGSRAESGLEVADRIARGLPGRALDRLKAEMDLTDSEVATALGLSAKTISRLRKRRPRTLDQVTSDRLYRVARIFSYATEVLGSERAARHWLRRRQRGLGMRIPLDLMQTDVGSREVEDMLGRIDYNVLW